jgi:formamidopyrimidine-DNA glycosylase
MPELPEVETVRRDLESTATGRQIKKLDVQGVRTVRRHDPRQLVEAVAGATVQRLRRHGKFLLIDLDHDVSIGVHLRMSGQLIWVDDPSTPLVKHTHARFVFDNGHELRFIDPRTFGELWLTGHDTPEIAHLGPDALNDVTNERVLADRLTGRKSPLKTLLLNQEVIAGLGNIYADEILWRAKLRYDRTPETLTRQSTKLLYEGLRQVIDGAVQARGSTLDDRQYVDMHGEFGGAQLLHEVYGREGEPCSRCGTPIRRVKFGGRSAHFCPRCQK